jgi:hypothetical protein
MEHFIASYHVRVLRKSVPALESSLFSRFGSVASGHAPALSVTDDSELYPGQAICVWGWDMELQGCIAEGRGVG